LTIIGGTYQLLEIQHYKILEGSQIGKHVSTPWFDEEIRKRVGTYKDVRSHALTNIVNEILGLTVTSKD